MGSGSVTLFLAKEAGSAKMLTVISENSRCIGGRFLNSVERYPVCRG